MEFPVYNIDNAPTASRARLEGAQKALGFVPNLYGVLSASPELFNAYQTLNGLFEATSFTPAERTVVWQTINHFHECHYCVPAHTAVANMQGIDANLIEALRVNGPLPTARLEVLRATARAIVEQRGQLKAEQWNAFEQAGFTAKQALEIVVGVSQKTISNYVNRFADTPLDDAFKQFASDKPAATSAARANP